MDTPFTKAAKRGEVFFEEPMMEDFPPQIPSCSRYARQIIPVCARDPASARPNPSRIDFLPSSMTSPGISSYLVETTNLPTYSVRPGALGKSFRGALPALPIECERRADPHTPRDGLPKSRLNKDHLLFRTHISGLSAVSMDHSAC